VNNNQNPTKRTLGREYAFKFLYKHLMPEFKTEKEEFLVNRSKLDSALSTFDTSFSEIDEEHPNNYLDAHTKVFAKELIIGSLTNEESSNELISKFLTNKNIDKVDRMNMAVLILGVFEMKLDNFKAPGIFINEYVNIAKKYCPNESAGFINSVLDKVAKEKHV
jgi:N utilization substance protein B